MKIIRIGFLCISIILLFIGGYFYFIKSIPVTFDPQAGVIQKYAPSDHYFLQRTYPDFKFESKAYQKAMQHAGQQRLQRSSVPGFNNPWVTQGPGNAGARVNTILVAPNDPTTIYLGYASGGIFKTTDNGNTWNPIFDDQPYLAIGDLAMEPGNPDVIYAGTGDPSVTGYPFVGNGLYKSTDAGNNWTNIGLSETAIISKIIFHPNDPQTIYVATMGSPFERNNDRGLYKTTNGGQTWEQILFIDNQTGVIDLGLDPNNPDIIFAAIWTRIRNNQESVLTSFGHKIYRSMDGGTNWQPLANGLPTGNGSRAGLAISLENPNTVFALFTTPTFQLDGIFKTTDNGENWTEIANSGTPIVGSSLLGLGWYMGRIRVNPLDDDNLYVLGVRASVTNDGGLTWQQATPNSGANAVHVDNHALVFDSNNNVILGTDGGAYRKLSGSTVWNDIENIPATQVYRTAYNPFEPNTYYGGFQDNGTQKGNASTINSWEKINGADGFQMAFNPEDSLNYYTETQNGGIFGRNSSINFYNAAAGIPNSDRRNWDMPYIISPHAGNTLYSGTYRIWKNDNQGVGDWSNISPDLTDGIIFGENFHTISTIDESTVEPGRLYVGTTDANVWTSPDDGDNWTEIKTGLPERYVTSIKASPYYAEGAYVTLSGYRANDNVPYLYRSLDSGNSWTNIASGLPALGINDVLVLPGHQDTVLFIGNDAGVYASLNSGGTWDRLGNNFPLVAVFDLAYNAERNQLIAGTHGRSIQTFDLDVVVYESVVLSGAIKDVNGDPVPDVQISITAGTSLLETSDTAGQYAFDRVPVHLEDCTITPVKKSNAKNGLTIGDVLLLQAHILNIDTLDSPYKLLAADVTQNNFISIADLIDLRKVILVIDTVFAQTDSWRFISEDHVFSNPEDPWAAPVLETSNCSDQEISNTEVNFTAIKMGDLNGNADPNQLDINGDTRMPFNLLVDDLAFGAGEEVTFKVTAEELSGLKGLQFRWQLNQASEVSVVFPDQKFDQYFYDINEKNLADGLVTGMIGTKTADDLGDLSYLLEIKFKAISAGTLQGIFKFDHDFESIAISEKQESRNLQIKFHRTFTPILNATLTTRIFPNPTTGAATISFQTTMTAKTQINLFTTNGEMLMSNIRNLPEGVHEFKISEKHLVGPGVYFVEVIKGTEREVKRLLKW